MSSRLSLIIANKVMEEVEQTALNTYLKPPSQWVRHVDDVYAITEKVRSFFLNYLNTVTTSIKFTKELIK